MSVDHIPKELKCKIIFVYDLVVGILVTGDRLSYKSIYILNSLKLVFYIIISWQIQEQDECHCIILCIAYRLVIWVI